MLRAEPTYELFDARVAFADVVEVVEHHLVDDVGRQHDVVDRKVQHAVPVDVEFRTLLADEVEVVGEM